MAATDEFVALRGSIPFSRPPSDPSWGSDVFEAPEDRFAYACSVCERQICISEFVYMAIK